MNTTTRNANSEIRLQAVEQMLSRLLGAIKEAEDIHALRRRAGQIKGDYDREKKSPQRLETG